ncbi:MAG: hypothetical protein J7M11_05135 [Elusimicrobia bacterium]|nr:hypothetical protein [Elusimicrobiota bacterium]
MKKKKIKLDKEEKKILEAYENGKLKAIKPHADYRSIARNTLKKKPGKTHCE